LFDRRISLGQFLTILTILGGIGAFLWKGGQVQQTMQSGIELEAQVRKAEFTALHETQQNYDNRLNQIGQDVREIRSYIVVKAEFPPGAHK
jgi:hypothetical protein